MHVSSFPESFCASRPRNEASVGAAEAVRLTRLDSIGEVRTYIMHDSRAITTDTNWLESWPRLTIQQLLALNDALDRHRRKLECLQKTLQSFCGAVKGLAAAEVKSESLARTGPRMLRHAVKQNALKSATRSHGS